MNSSQTRILGYSYIQNGIYQILNMLKMFPSSFSSDSEEDSYLKIWCILLPSNESDPTFSTFQGNLKAP